MNSAPKPGTDRQPAPEPLRPLPRGGMSKATGMLLQLMLLLAAAAVGTGICAMRTTSETEVMVAEGLSLASLLLLAFGLWRLTRTARGILPVLITVGIFLAYLTQSLIPTAVLVGLIFGVGVGSSLLALADKRQLTLFAAVPVLAYGVTLLLSKDPVGSVAALVPFPPMIVLAYGTRRSAAAEDGPTRIGVICATTLASILSLGAMIALSLYRHLGSLELTVLKEALEVFRESLVQEIISMELPTEGMTSEAIAEMKEMFTYANVSNRMDSLFNILPGLAVVTVNILAATAQLIQHAALREMGHNDSLTGRVKVFRLSLVSCVVFLAAYLVAVLENAAVATLAGTVAQNIYIILLPGLALEAMVRMMTALTQKGPHKLGCLFYLVLLIPCLFFIAPFALAIIEVIARLFGAITSAIKPPEDPDAPF